MKTEKLRRFIASLALAGLFGAGAVPSAFGCGFHPAMDVELDTMYPGSLSVAVALYKGAENGMINGVAIVPGSSDTGYSIAVQRLQAFAKVLATSPAAAELPASFSLGYVESRLWSRFSQQGGKVRVDVHTDGPSKGEAVVLTGEPVVTAILDGRVSIERALSEGMLVIEGNKRETTAIREALDAMHVSGKMSMR